MGALLYTKLCVMMFLEFFVWGAWYVIMGNYLGAIGFSGQDVGLAYSAAGWAAIISPFFVGMVADRFFAAEKVLAVMHLLGAALMFWVTTITTPYYFFAVLLAYTITYMPTVALVNAISFNHMDDPGKEFPRVRVLGTLGWIVAGLMISAFEWLAGRGIFPSLENIESTSFPFKMAAVCALIMGIYSFFLPHTPPKALGHKVRFGDIVGVQCLKLLKERAFAIFTISSLVVCIPLAFYYSFANPFLNEVGMTKVAGKMTMGQMSEVFFMLVMPFFFKRLGVKWMLLIGMLAWVTRYALFAFGGDESGLIVSMLYTGILLHGICYDFFFVTGQIYVDRKAPKEIQANAQGFFALITYGVGMVIGTNVAGFVTGMYELPGGGHDWRSIWLIPAIMAAVVVGAFFVLFNDPNADGKKEANE